MNLAAMFCRKLLMLKDARVFACGDTADVLTEAHIGAMYGVRTRVTAEDGSPHVRLLKETADGAEG